MGELGKIQIVCGDGKGKTNSAVGRAVRAAALGQNVFIIRFLKGNNVKDSLFIKRLEPEIKLFVFEKAPACFKDLSDEQKQEEIQNIRNGLNFAKKVMQTSECDVLILDEVLGLVDENIITVDDLKGILQNKPGGMSLIMTGVKLAESMKELADEIYRIETVKE